MAFCQNCSDSVNCEEIKQYTEGNKIHLKGNKILGPVIFLLVSRSPKTYGPRLCFCNAKPSPEKKRKVMSVVAKTGNIFRAPCQEVNFDFYILFIYNCIWFATVTFWHKQAYWRLHSHVDIYDAACTVAVYGPAVLFFKTQAPGALCGLNFIKPEDATPESQCLMLTMDPLLALRSALLSALCFSTAAESASSRFNHTNFDFCTGSAYEHLGVMHWNMQYILGDSAS